MNIDPQPYPASCHLPEPRIGEISSAYDRWAFQLDMNCDGGFTTSDVWLMAKSVFVAPGDFLLMTLSSTELSTYVELSNLRLGGGASLVMSIVGWIIILVFLSLFFEWLEACVRKIDKWSRAFGEWTDRLRGKEGAIKKKPGYDEWIKSERKKTDR